jgi:exopolyphosphatase / guanosine-5'-triphosphate,3'-diphosphate pyrophosphatase
MVLAVIDLGTNIFTIKIVDQPLQGPYRVLHKESRFVKLAEDGIECIGPGPYSRALDVIIDYGRQLSYYQVEKYRAIGTAALRTASNGPTLMAQMEEYTGIQISMISGAEEARLIHWGVEQNVPLGKSPKLIMDIGGGSVEFIIANDREVFWAKSFLVGIALLRRQFHRQEPIAKEEIAALRAFLHENLQELAAALQQFQVDVLVGTSGTFDILASNYPLSKIGSDCNVVKAEAIELFLPKILDKNQEQRANMREFPPSRSDMVVVAMLLIQFVHELAGVDKLWVTNFDLKEGLIREML